MRPNPERHSEYDPLREKTTQRRNDEFLENPQIEFSDPKVIPGGAILDPVDPTGAMHANNQIDRPEEVPMKDYNDKNHTSRNDTDESVFDKAKDWVDEKVDQVKDKFDDMTDDKNDVENKVQDTATNTKHEVEEAAEKAARRVDNAGEPLEDAQNWAGDKVSEAKHGVGKAVDKAKNRTDD